MFFESHVSCMCWLLSQHQQLDGEPVSDLQAFIMQCKDPPESGCFSENETRGRCLMCCLHRWTHTRHVSIRDDQRWCEELQKEWLTCQFLLLYLFWTSLKLFWLETCVRDRKRDIVCLWCRICGSDDDTDWPSPGVCDRGLKVKISVYQM